MNPYWKERAKHSILYSLLPVIICVGMIYGLFFRQNGSKTVNRVAKGGTAITNVYNTAEGLKQGVYLRGASDRASVGVFKEVLPNIDVSIGAGKDYDEDAFVEVETRFKF